MTYLTDSADRPSGFDISELNRIDRILLGSCAAVWLAALGAGVAATVALVDLARVRTASGGESGTPWILYTVIAVSAAVIVAAVPLLLRARRAAQVEPAAAPRPEPVAPQSPSPEAPVPGAEAPTEKLRIAPATVPPEPSEPETEAPHAPTMAAIDQLWLRCTVAIACAMGVATLLTAISTYLMAVGSDTVAWVLYVIGGVVIVGMVAIPWYGLRDLRALIDDVG